MPINETQKKLNNFQGVRTGVVHWQQKQSAAIITGIARALEYLGCEVENFVYSAKLPENLDVIFICGPFESLIPLTNQLLALPEKRRPALAYIMTEQLPNPGLPEWLRYGGGMARLQLEKLAYRQESEGDWQLSPAWRWLAYRMHRFRYYGELFWLQRQGLLSALVIPSLWTADFLRQRGFNPITQPPSAMQGANLELERDIQVLWLGKQGSSRRGRVLKQIRAELKERGVEVLNIDGVENPYVFGEERTHLLNRSKIVLNILREKWDDNSMRYTLAAPCKALIVTEPTLPHSYFKPGIHLVEVPLEQMTDTICHYLAHEEERQVIVENAYQLITRHSGLEKIIQILERALNARQSASLEAKITFTERGNHSWQKS